METRPDVSKLKGCHGPTFTRSDLGVSAEAEPLTEVPETMVEGNEWQRDCPTSFDFQGMQVDLFQPTRSTVMGPMPTIPPTRPGMKRSNLRWSDLEDDLDEDSDILTLWGTHCGPFGERQTSEVAERNPERTPGEVPKDARNAEILWAWDAASDTNSEVPEETTARRDDNYPASEPPRTRGKFSRATNREGRQPRQDRQTRNTRHHNKKEGHLPPRPNMRHPPRDVPGGDSGAGGNRAGADSGAGHGNDGPNAELGDAKQIRSRHLQVVERDHLPTRFHREDQRQALSKEMQESAQQMYEGWGNKKRMSTVLAAMEELPKRVGEDMHKLASHVVDSVQSEINEVSTVIRGETAQSTETTKAMKHLEVIPTMVLNLLESRMEKAKAQVREKVGGMIQQLSAIHEEDTHEGGEELAEQMQDMSSEVAKIAGDAVEAAAQECRAHATQQLDIALASLRDPGPDDELEEDEAAIKWKKVCKIRNAVEDDLLLQKNVETIFPAAAMDTALAVIKDKDFMPHSVTNEVVADQLLRAKVRGRGDVRAPSSVGTGRGVDLPQMPPQNPGSLGHPDLCPRPCIYYRSGTCTSGAECTFCHMSHSRRPLRLDKRHREALKRMPFKKLLKVVVPILASKVTSLAEEKLSSLYEVPMEGDALAEQQDPATPPAEDAMPQPGSEDEVANPAAMTKVNMAEIKMDVLTILEQLAQNAGLGSIDLTRIWIYNSSAAGNTSSRRHSVGEPTSTCSTGSSSSDQDSGRDKKVWLRALQVMNLRSLLVMIRRLARDSADGAQEDLQLLEQIIARIQSAFGKSAPVFEEDEPDRFEAVKEDEPLRVIQDPCLTNPVRNKLPVANVQKSLPVQLRLSQLVP